jgi:uncharacterized protein YozE (UPF0346 family)
MSTVTVSQETINLVVNRIGFPLEHFDFENLLEFITFNGIYEPSFKEWDSIPELWSEWREK